MNRNRPRWTKSPERLVLHRVLINSKRFYIHTNLIKFVIAHFKLENRSMSCTFQLICIASLLAFSTFILVFMQNCRDCRFSNSETTPMLPLIINTRYDKRNFSARKCAKGNVSPIEKVTRKFFLETPSPPLRSYMEKLHRRRFYHDGTPAPP